MVIEKTVLLYSFDELSDSAKEKARDWFRSCSDSSDFDSVIEDFERIANILGVELKQRSFRTMGGGTRTEPIVRWGLYSQGSGAAFEGSYSYAKGAAKKIREYAPQDAELHRIADELQAVQVKHGYSLTARMSDGPLSNFYPHSGTMTVEVENSRTGDCPDAAVEETITQAMRNLADWLYRTIEKEDEYQSSDEVVDGNITANEYTFREDGKRED